MKHNRIYDDHPEPKNDISTTELNESKTLLNPEIDETPELEISVPESLPEPIPAEPVGIDLSGLTFST